MISRWNKISRFDKQEISLKYVSSGEHGVLFKKLINSNWLAFTCQWENVMKRVTLGEPINTLSESGFTIRFAESFCGQLEVGLLEVRYPAMP